MNKSRGNTRRKTLDSLCVCLRPLLPVRMEFMDNFLPHTLKWMLCYDCSQSGNCLNSEFFPYLLFTLVRKIKTKNPQNEWELKVLAWWQTAGQWTQQEGR